MGLNKFIALQANTEDFLEDYSQLSLPQILHIDTSTNLRLHVLSIRLLLLCKPSATPQQQKLPCAPIVALVT
jgi:hypothetical protein